MSRRHWRLITQIIRTERVAIAALAISGGTFLCGLTIADALVDLSTFWTPPTRVAIELASPDGQVLQFFRFEEYQTISAVPALAGVSAFAKTQTIARVGDLALPILCAVVTPNYFEIRGITASRGLLPSTRLDFTAASERSVVITSRLASRMLGTSPIGTSLILNQVPFVVAAVIADGQGRNFGVEPDAWISISSAGGVFPDSRPTSNLEAMGPSGGASFVLEARLAPQISVRDARTQLAALRFRGRGAQQVARIQPASANLPSTLRAPITRALGISGFALTLFLLVAVGNTAILMTHRVMRNARERTIRYMLGASRARLIGEVVLTAATLSLLAAIGSVLISVGLAVTLRSQLPIFIGIEAMQLLPRLWVLLLFVGAIQLCGLIAIIIPAALMVRSEWNGRSTSDPSVRSAIGTAPRLELAVLLVQVTCATLLMTWSGVLIDRWHNLTSSDLGLRPNNVQVISLYVDPLTKSTPQRFELYHRALERLRIVPGVRAAALASTGPLTPPGDALEIDRRPAGTIYVDTVGITADYFSVLTMRTTRGAADLRAGDDLVLNESALALARRGGSGAGTVDVGTRMRGRTIVGIVGDTRRDRIDVTTEPTWFRLFAEADARSSVVMVVAGHQSTVSASDLTAALKGIDQELVVVGVRSLSDQINQLAWRSRTTAVISLWASLAAVVMAAISVFAVVSGVVTRNYRELAIRLALGAVPSTLIRSMLLKFGGVTATAFVAGSLAAASQWKLLKSIDASLPSGASWIVVIASAGLLFGTVIIACHRASRPVVSLTPASLFRSGEE